MSGIGASDTTETPWKLELDCRDSFWEDESIRAGGEVMVSDLKKLSELVELDSLPSWIRQDIESRKEEILQKLQTDGYFDFQGPQGQKATIRVNMKVAAA